MKRFPVAFSGNVGRRWTLRTRAPTVRSERLLKMSWAAARRRRHRGGCTERRCTQVCPAPDCAATATVGTSSCPSTEPVTATFWRHVPGRHTPTIMDYLVPTGAAGTQDQRNYLRSTWHTGRWPRSPGRRFSDLTVQVNADPPTDQRGVPPLSRQSGGRRAVTSQHVGRAD
jgi:hypothetical protein